MSRYKDTLLKVLASEKELASFLQSGEVEHIVGLFQKKNESFVLFYLKTNETKKSVKNAEKGNLK